MYTPCQFALNYAASKERRIIEKLSIHHAIDLLIDRNGPHCYFRSLYKPGLLAILR